MGLLLIREAHFKNQRIKVIVENSYTNSGLGFVVSRRDYIALTRKTVSYTNQTSVTMRNILLTYATEWIHDSCCLRRYVPLSSAYEWRTSESMRLGSREV